MLLKYKYRGKLIVYTVKNKINNKGRKDIKLNCNGKFYIINGFFFKN